MCNPVPPISDTHMSQGQLCLLAKTPQCGKVKTRLEPHLGAEGCLQLHKWLVEDQVKRLMEHSGYDLALYVTGDLNHPYWQTVRRSYGVNLYLQCDGDLGARMYDAVNRTLTQRPWVILIGADCPALDARYVQEAINQLEYGADAVIGPAEDGGYVLLGLSRPIPEIFLGVDWGTSRVLSQTMNKMDHLGMRPHLLNPLRDLDVWADYQFYLNWVKHQKN